MMKTTPPTLLVLATGTILFPNNATGPASIYASRAAQSERRGAAGPGIRLLQNPKGENLNGMEKPPFQFGLKAVFAATTGVAVFMAAGDLVRLLVCTAVIWVIGVVLLLAFVVAILLFVEQVVRDMIRLACWTWNRFRLRS